jgi:hypothetical protein
MRFGIRRSRTLGVRRSDEVTIATGLETMEEAWLFADAPTPRAGD